MNFDIIKEDNCFKLMKHNCLYAYIYFEINEPCKFIDEKYISLYNFYSLYKNSGYGTHLLNNVIENFKDMKISLIVDKGNRVISLYRRSGFRIFEEYEDSLCMIKNKEENI